MTPATTTRTVTKTETSTTVSYTATAYAACATGTGNIVYSAGPGGSPINGINQNGGLTFAEDSSGEASGSACCAACFADPRCAVAGFLEGIGCYKFLASSAAACNAPNAFSAGVEAVQPEFAGSKLYLVSNGPCGQYNRVDTGQ